MSETAIHQGTHSPVLIGALLASLVGHAAGLIILDLGPRPAPSAPQRPIEMVVVEVEPPKPPPPPPEEVKPVPVKPPPPPKIKVAKAERPPPPPLEEAPPPPNEPAAEPPPQPVPLVVGVTMSSTTTAGGFAAPVGNTAYGKTDKTAVDPSQVKRYSAPKYMPIYQVDSQPEVLNEVKVDPYPAEARRAGIEGTVRLSITVDFEGRVVKANVLDGPGYGLNEAALAAIKRFKFKPAYKAGEAVSTDMKYNYTFLLD